MEMQASADSDLKFLLIAGKPIGEPIVQHGPFVMNTQVRRSLIELVDAMRHSWLAHCWFRAAVLHR